jgi:Flp pilus assembly protein TadD
VSSRYRLPLVSAAIPLAGIAAADLAARLKDRAWRSALIRAAALAALAIAVRPVPSDVRVRDHTEERYNEGTVLLGLGRNREAEAVFRAAWAERQDDGRIASNLGAALALMGNLEEAKRAYRESLKIDPNRGGTRLALGAILLQEGDRAGARRELEAARALGVELPPAEREALGAGEPPPGAAVP